VEEGGNIFAPARKQRMSATPDPAVNTPIFQPDTVMRDRPALIKLFIDGHRQK
jgi:hypothetical protein